MSSSRLPFTLAAALGACLMFATTVARAGDCVVTSGAASGSGSLSAAIAQAAQGNCSSSSTPWLARYESYLQLPATLQVVRIPKTVDIYLEAPLKLRAHGNTPLLIIADTNATVRLLGNRYTSSEAALQIDSGTIILDHISLRDFPHTPVIISGNNTLLINSTLQQSGTSPALLIRGNDNTITKSDITGSVQIDDGLTAGQCSTVAGGKNNRLLNNQIHDSVQTGVTIRAAGTTLTGNVIHNHKTAAIQLQNRNDACPDLKTIYTVKLSQNHVHHNAHGVLLESELVPPVDLINITALDAPYYHIVGNIGRNPAADYPWDDAHLNLQGARVELFLAQPNDGRQGFYYLGSTTISDVAKRSFSMNIAKPLIVNGQEVTAPIFVATLTDPEHHNSSRYSDPLDVLKSQDWDGDGIANEVEALNRTDPRLPDSDGDGLSDGEEILHNGRIAQLLEKNSSAFADLSRLNPSSADSDGDCLPDGLEMGIGSYAKFATQQYSPLTAPAMIFANVCLKILEDHKVESLLNATLQNDKKKGIKNIITDNVLALVDLDPASMTDPTSKDTDQDGLMDGAEDWNFDGKRQEAEADPNVSDTDKDGLRDGDEAHNTTSPLLTDSDGDGIQDNTEIRQFGSDPNHCDSDKDGIPDGIEGNAINPNSKDPNCVGLQTAGSNFANPTGLNPMKKDSDGDGLEDGQEDINHNGWLDPNESDPTVSDTDSDGISDYAETTGDNDHDSIADFQIVNIKQLPRCSHDITIDDLDCDGLSNAQDTDSDNDSCSDRDEGFEQSGDTHTVPAAYDASVKHCGSTTSGGGGASPTAGGSASPVASENEKSASYNAYWANRTDGGGNCSLTLRPTKPTTFPVFFLATFTIAVLVSARFQGQKNP